MPTPNEPTPPKKPTNPSAKPPVAKPDGKAPPPKAEGKPDGKAPPPRAEGKLDSKAPPPKAPEGKPDAKAQPPKAEGKPAAKPDGRAAAPKKVVKGGAAPGGRRKLGQILIDLGLVTEDQLWEILEESKGSGSTVGQTALNRGLVDENQLFQALAEQHGMKIVDMEDVKPTPEALQLVPETMATVYKCLPLTVKDKILTVILSDPSNPAALDDLRNFLGVKDVKALCAPPKIVEESIARFYAGKEESILDLIQQIEADSDLTARLGSRKETSIDLESLMEIQDAAPVRKLLNMVMLLAIKDHASDIHFEPFEDEYKLRYRCDGVLMELVPPPRHLAMAISSRIKVMSNLDIAERRLPQDGRIELNLGGNMVDMRVSVLPTMFGESVVIRVLDRTVVQLDLNKIGMDTAILATFRQLIRKPNGIILVTGPTGSGKTTTLYSALNELNEITDKIITTEDPVEYEIDGICQCQINSDIDLTFANALRSILRQDPVKILVGEIRDLETAQIAVQASLTGHMVFSTLHTNDAPTAITRLRDMGVEAYLITATLEGILAQRLVRKICEDCRTEFEPSPEMLMELNLRSNEVKNQKFFYGRGCERCNNTGHRGRSGSFELVPINDELRDLISTGVSTDELRKHCRQQGMETLREAGLRALFSGITTIEEIVRETVLEEDL